MNLAQQAITASRILPFLFDDLESEENIYAYAGQNPLQLIDPMGLACGDVLTGYENSFIYCYKSIKQNQLLSHYDPNYMNPGWEYAGHITYQGNGNYRAEPPYTIGKSDSGLLEQCPNDGPNAGWEHNHPDLPDHDVDNFSDADRLTSYLEQVPGHLWSQHSGDIKEYIPPATMPVYGPPSPGYLHSGRERTIGHLDPNPQY